MDDKLALNVSEQIAALRKTLAQRSQPHTATTLVKQPDLRVVLVVMSTGARLNPHRAAESVSIQVMEGAVRLQLPTEIVRAQAGTLLTLRADVLHDVEALEDSAFLLFLPWPAGHHSSAPAANASPEADKPSS
ncbi:MAG: hypothetical protein ABI551_24160 [Polyangiaceae bacterium]